MKNSYKYSGIDFSGFQNGRLTVLEKANRGRSWWRCKCECGKELELPVWKFKENKSCGCLEKENLSNLSSKTKTHGMTKTRLYSVWCGIKDRCLNPNTEHYDRYGGRGITICEDWQKSFESFRDWAYSVGYDDSLTGKFQSIERVNVNGNYEPSNCKWVSSKEQARNTSRTVYVDFEGKRVPLSAFCEKNGITYSAFVRRHLKNGCSATEIIRIWEFKHNNHPGYYTLKEASGVYSVSEQSIKKWIDKGILKAENIGGSWFVKIG